MASGSAGVITDEVITWITAGHKRKLLNIFK